MNEVTIEITNYCPHYCGFCSSNASRRGKSLPFEKIQRFLIYKQPKGKKYDRVNISGGEPLSHPEFYEILQLCKNLAKQVVVYTNELEHIAFNARVIKEVHVHAQVPLVPGSYVRVPKGSFEVNLLKFISQGRGRNIPEVEMTASCNIGRSQKTCETCSNLTLKANGEVVPSPCKKD